MIEELMQVVNAGESAPVFRDDGAKASITGFCQGGYDSVTFDLREVFEWLLEHHPDVFERIKSQAAAACQ